MRILLVSANFRPSVGGIERFTEVLAAGLATRGHDVTVLCCRKDRAPLHEHAAGFRIVRLPATYVLHRALRIPYPLPAPLGLLRTVPTLLRHADVVHVQDGIYATSAAALGWARRIGIPSVLTQHVAFVPQRNAALDAVERVALRTLGRSVRLATRVVTLNPAVANWAERQWGLDGVEALPVGVPEIRNSVDVAAVRASFGLPRDRFLALFVGRDVPKKGLDYFLGASDPAYELVAVTDRPTARESRAHIVPFMQPERLHELLAAVDAFVLPSIAEGFPVSIQEALAAGLPVVTTGGEGYDHYLRSGEVLLVERSAEAVRRELRRLATDDALRTELSRRAYEAAHREFGVDRFVEAYEALYSDVVGGSHDYPGSA